MTGRTVRDAGLMAALLLMVVMPAVSAAGERGDGGAGVWMEDRAGPRVAARWGDGRGLWLGGWHERSAEPRAAGAGAEPRAGDGVALAQGDADGAGVVVELAGDRLWAYRSAPVYRRFDTLELAARHVALRGDERVLVTFKREPMSGGAGEVVYRQLHRVTPGREELRVELALGTAADPLPAGRYRLALWRQTGRGLERIADTRVYLIFNAHEPADGDAHRAAPEPWLTGVLYMVQMVGGEFRINPWRLDIHDPRVFELAMRLIDGSEHGATAARRLIPGTLAHVDGYWPDLVDTSGRIPESDIEVDHEWRAGVVTSAAQRIAQHDTRGQCFDYAMLYVALLRSVGVPARTVTITRPAPMPHPDAPDRQVRWDYHVWAEVSIGGWWWAVDLSYLDEPVAGRLRPEHDPEFQPTHGPWFAQAIGSDSRVWIVEGDQLRDLSDRYGAFMARWRQGLDVYDR